MVIGVGRGVIVVIYLGLSWGDIWKVGVVYEIEYFIIVYM